MDTELIPYDKILHNTGDGGATLFMIDGDEQWIPNSVIEEIYEQDHQVEVPIWFAEKEGLI